MIYKIGDKVKCLESRGWSGYFITNKVYEIVKTYREFITITCENEIDHMVHAEYFCDFKLVKPKKIDGRFSVQKELLNNHVNVKHNFRYDAYMETRDQIIEAEFEKRRVLTKGIYDELDMAERIKIGL